SRASRHRGARPAAQSREDALKPVAASTVRAARAARRAPGGVTAMPVAPLLLRNGMRVERPFETALEFVRADSSYRRYDLAPVLQDDVLTEADIGVANAIIARMPKRVIAAIVERAPAINAA